MDGLLSILTSVVNFEGALMVSMPKMTSKNLGGSEG